jgi:hypothetical protein
MHVQCRIAAALSLISTFSLAAPPLLDFTVHLGEGGRSEQLIFRDGDTPADVSEVACLYTTWRRSFTTIRN